MVDRLICAGGTPPPSIAALPRDCIAAPGLEQVRQGSDKRADILTFASALERARIVTGREEERAVRLLRKTRLLQLFCKRVVIAQARGCLEVYAEQSGRRRRHGDREPHPAPRHLRHLPSDAKEYERPLRSVPKVPLPAKDPKGRPAKGGLEASFCPRTTALAWRELLAGFCVLSVRRRSRRRVAYPMKSTIIKRSVIVNGHRTSVSVERVLDRTQIDRTPERHVSRTS